MKEKVVLQVDLFITVDVGKLASRGYESLQKINDSTVTKNIDKNFLDPNDINPVHIDQEL